MDLRGASADSLAELTAELERRWAPAPTPSAWPATCSTSPALLRTEPSLRRFATDASLPADYKQTLVRQVLEGKIDEATLALVISARRPSLDRHPRLRRRARAAQRDRGRPVGRRPGRRASPTRSSRSARLVTANPDLRDALSNPARSVEDKSALLDSLLGGKVLPATVTLAKQALAGTYRTMTAALETYRQVAAAVHGEAVATVHVVRPLGDADRDRLAAALKAQYGREIHLNEIVDPSVIGGMRVEIGDDVFDATVSSRLDDARRKLVG